MRDERLQTEGGCKDPRGDSDDSGNKDEIRPRRDERGKEIIEADRDKDNGKEKGGERSGAQ